MVPSEYRPIPGFARYFVNEVGVVWSDVVKKGPLKPIARGPYLYATLGRGNMKSIHELVLITFVGPRPSGMETRHLDGDSRNNRVENLAWGTSRENSADTNRHGNGTQGIRNAQARLTEAQVLEIKRLRDSGVTIRTLSLQFGVSDASIVNIAKGRRWKHLVRVQGSVSTGDQR